MTGTGEAWRTLVQAEALAAAIARGADDLVVLDCRVSLADRGAGERLWRESHLPGALRADLERDLSDMRKAGRRERLVGGALREHRVRTEVDQVVALEGELRRNGRRQRR